MLLGFTRHDRFQSRLRFWGPADAGDSTSKLCWTAFRTTARWRPSLWRCSKATSSRRRCAAGRASWPPSRRWRRASPRRITGWCSWYNLYAAIDERAILEHLAAAARFRDEHRSRSISSRSTTVSHRKWATGSR